MANRRKFLSTLAAGSLAASILPTIAHAGTPTNAKRSLRIAHITDVHMIDQPNARRSFSRVIADLNAMSDRPDLIINTGDSVMDENKQTKETVTRHWNTWSSITAPNKIPMRSALGNHDVWYGPDAVLDAEYKKDKLYGKQWAMSMLNMELRYYSFEMGGWHFICLDSINGRDSYQLDDAQFNWLASLLEKIPSKAPVCVFSHVPIISIGAMLYLTQRTPAIETKFPVGDMHLDHDRIKDLFNKHQKVRLCLSGHVHYVDAIDYLGVKYLCNGAISGNWWRDPIVLDEFPPVYTIIDLYDDGSSQHQSIFYPYQS